MLRYDTLFIFAPCRHYRYYDAADGQDDAAYAIDILISLPLLLLRYIADISPFADADAVIDSSISPFHFRLFSRFSLLPPRCRHAFDFLYASCAAPPLRCLLPLHA